MPTLKKPKPNNLFAPIGFVLLLFGGVLLLKLAWEPLKLETRYTLSRTINSPRPPLTPVNTDFSLVIEKIGAMAPIVQDVNSQDSGQYQRALTRGIAHAAGTSLPGQGGNIFLFAHSSANPLDASRFNSVFYLVHHLEIGNEIQVWYQGQKHVYSVTSKRIVSPTDIAYLNPPSSDEQLTLMTCWPPGTTFKRLIVVAKPLAL
ncbi:MAG: Lpxtg-site transpeptidase (Sortase) family protein [Microgenomates group bacterium GW2011_GWC2_46_7]|nr:MAG: Lpxtg-site transpeptidase (Sortase) family protein [Microgenomates group bacterium GW2011_GWC2_46_7]